jgi:hypothetical protein
MFNADLPLVTLLSVYHWDGGFWFNVGRFGDNVDVALCLSLLVNVMGLLAYISSAFFSELSPWPKVSNNYIHPIRYSSLNASVRFKN